MLSQAYNLWPRFVNFFYNQITKIKNSDPFKIFTLKDAFILDELTKRALNSSQGYAVSSLGIKPFPPIYRFLVVTDLKYISSAISYGEFDPNHPEYFDPKARTPFNHIEKFLGAEFLINKVGNVSKERAALRNHIQPNKGIQLSNNLFSEMSANWNEQSDVHYMVSYACIRIISGAWFGVTDLPEKIVPLLKRAEHIVFNLDKVPNKEFVTLKKEFDELSDQLVEEHFEVMSDFSRPNYLQYLHGERFGENAVHTKENYKKLKPFLGLIVEGNITTLLSELIILLAERQDLQDRLQKELNILESTDLTNLRHSSFLNALYLEGLRFFAPSPPGVRYASKAGKILAKTSEKNLEYIEVSSRTYIFVPFRQICRSSKIWGVEDDPNQFIPERFERLPSTIKISISNFFDILPAFASGSRACPAGKNAFAEVIVKCALFQLFKNKKLLLSSPSQLEEVSVFTKEPRLLQLYYIKSQCLPSNSSKEDNSLILNANSDGMRTVHQSCI